MRNSGIRLILCLVLLLSLLVACGQEQAPSAASAPSGAQQGLATAVVRGVAAHVQKLQQASEQASLPALAARVGNRIEAVERASMLFGPFRSLLRAAESQPMAQQIRQEQPAQRGGQGKQLWWAPSAQQQRTP